MNEDLKMYHVIERGGTPVDERVLKSDALINRAAELGDKYRQTVIDLFHCRSEMAAGRQRQMELAEQFEGLKTTSEKIAAEIRAMASDDE